MLVEKLSRKKVSPFRREDQFKDGILFDVTDQARATGFIIPVALTRSVMSHCIGGKMSRVPELLQAAHDAALQTHPGIDFRTLVADRVEYVDLRLVLTFEEGAPALTIMHK